MAERDNGASKVWWVLGIFMTLCSTGFFTLLARADADYKAKESSIESIRKETADEREKVRKDAEKSRDEMRQEFVRQVEDIKEDQKEMRLEQKKFVDEYRQDQKTQGAVNMEILVTLKKLETKMNDEN